MRGIRLVIGLMLLAAACDHSAQQRVLEVCDTVCECTAAPTATAQDVCVRNCVGTGNPSDLSGQISDACLTCLSGHVGQCATIQVDCEPICNFGGTQNPPPPPPVIVDAFMPVVD